MSTKTLLTALGALAIAGAAVWVVPARDAGAQQEQEQAQGSPERPRETTTGIMRRPIAPPQFPRFDRASIANGRAVAVGATQGGASQATQPQACFTCHGLHGAGDGTGAFPRISGQPAFYLFKQLADYASGARPNAIMTPIAQALTVQEMEDVAAYYAAQTDAPYHPPTQTFDPLLIQQGGALSAIGSAEKGIQACVNCHGPNGTGMGPVYPYLAGQYASYTELQLQLWQRGERKNDPLNVMADIARRMSPRDIQAVAAYFASMRPPGARTAVDQIGTALPPAAPAQNTGASGATR